jgi:hypothetical protein
VLTPSAGNCNDPRIPAIQETGNLRRLREAGADYSNANLILSHGASIITQVR